MRGVSLQLHRIGFSPQMPKHRPIERDEEAIATWREEAWTQAKASGRAWGVALFRGRSGSHATTVQGADLGASRANTGHPGVRQGIRPHLGGRTVLRPPRHQHHGTDASALPDQDPPQRKGERNSFAETDYAALLDAAHQYLKTDLVVIWDNLNTHTSKAMRKFAEMADKWIDTRHKLRKSTWWKYRGLLDNHVLPRWGELSLNKLLHADEDIEVWVGGLLKSKDDGGSGLGPSQARHAYRAFAAVLEWCVPKRIPRNPARGVELPDLPEYEHVYLTYPQVEELAEASGQLRTKYN